MSSHKYIHKLNQNGVALLNVIIFSSILSLMGLAFMQLTDQQNKSLEASKANFEIYEFVDKARIALSSPEACFETFKNQPYATDFTVPALKRTYVDPATQNKVILDLISVTNTVAPGYKLSEIKLRNVDTANRKGFVDLKIDRIPGVGSGIASFTKSIEIIALDPGSPMPTGTITNCFATGTNIDDPAILCSSLGGVWNPTKVYCDGIVAVDPTPVFCTNYSKRRLAQDANKRLKIVCDPCTPVDQFDKWKCESYPGKSSYSNMCYYRKVCKESTNQLMRPAIWNGVKGPIDSQGGDTGSHSACVSKRYLCAGEPAGTQEGMSAP